VLTDHELIVTEFRSLAALNFHFLKHFFQLHGREG